MVMLIRGLAAKNSLIRENKAENEKLEEEIADLRLQVKGLKSQLDSADSESEHQVVAFSQQLANVNEEHKALQLQLLEQSELAGKLSKQYSEATEALSQVHLSQN
jgi:predicted RNase H-like nuclease (RuvC/YqgF family)